MIRELRENNENKLFIKHRSWGLHQTSELYYIYYILLKLKGKGNNECLE